MTTAHLIGVALGLAGGLVWGAGDFSGGLAARSAHALQVLATAALSGAVVLTVLALLRAEPWPAGADAGWSAGAGVAGALGIGTLYLGLARGRAAVVAPTSAVIGALVPVGWGLLSGAPPGAWRLAGFAFALAGIWLLSRAVGSAAGSAARADRRDLALGAIAGLGFGAFLVIIPQVGTDAVFAPLVLARAVMLAGAVVLLFAGGARIAPIIAVPAAWLAGALDAGGNALYVFATHYTRMDVAAVLTSLYPASTVLLAVVVLRERVTRGQWTGLAACLAAVALIAS